MKVRRLLIVWLAFDAAVCALLLVGGGRESANAHPLERNGGRDWYWWSARS